MQHGHHRAPAGRDAASRRHGRHNNLRATKRTPGYFERARDVITELGHFALVAAFVISLFAWVLPLVGIRLGSEALVRFAAPASLAMAGTVCASFAALVTAFTRSDFSVALVANHSHSAKPLIYKISGTWGNHEGSLLMWIVILALFAGCLAVRGGDMRRDFRAIVLSVQAMVTCCFLAFSLFTSNPFLRLDPAPLDGRGLNPILQDPGLALHPPTLYVGYVGLSMAFAFAVAGLIEGRIDRDWARHVRPWVSVAWCALTAGIALGSWWAYYELGWGGWWFWDPVENASLMPWLAATALLHSTIVVEQRGALRSWSVLLAILAFSLSLVGTFIVRSGLLTSVHSFASDPSRGVFILMILLLAVGAPLVLFAMRGPRLGRDDVDAQGAGSASVAGHGTGAQGTGAQGTGGLGAGGQGVHGRADGHGGQGGNAWMSREGALVLNNLFLVAATAVVLLGTFYPLALEMVTGQRISVGPPFFEATFNPIMGLCVLAMAVGPLLAWRGGALPGLRAALWTGLVGALVLVLLGSAAGRAVGPFGLAGMGLLGWTVLAILADMRRALYAGGPALRQVPLRQWGMWTAHLGVAVFLAGALASSLFQSEVVERVKPGQSFQVADKQVRFREVVRLQGPNYITETALLELFSEGTLVAILRPEKRFYAAERQTTTEAAIRTRPLGDDYAVLGDGDAERGYTLRVYRKPLVSWIWAGAAIMVAGGAMGAISRRRRVVVGRVVASGGGSAGNGPGGAGADSGRRNRTGGTGKQTRPGAGRGK